MKAVILFAGSSLVILTLMIQRLRLLKKRHPNSEMLIHMLIRIDPNSTEK